MVSLHFFKRVAAKPFSVIFFRLQQDVLLRFKDATGYWGQKSKKIEQYYKTNYYLDTSTVLIHAAPGFLNEQQRKILFETFSLVMSSQFKIFGHVVPDLDECDFSSDWRFKKKWTNQYYKKYRFYEEKEIPYDVKFPWELSRLHYLIPVFAWQWADKTDYRVLEKILKFLCRWRDENPLAYSVNWYPMEASMRVLNLVLMLDFVRLLKCKTGEKNNKLDELGKQLTIMLTEHGEFIWANREFTDVRGNHFTANLTALLLASYSLGSKNSASRRWGQYAVKWLDKEIPLQFCDDGVNFEKSCAYHKLVLELFMVTSIARDRKGNPFARSSKVLLENAACYSDAIMRPDGLAANFGDTDDAIALPFTIDNTRSHGPIVELVRTYFNKTVGTISFDDKSKLASLFLLGDFHQQSIVPRSREVIIFPEGGYLIVRCQENGFFFMVDIGEVGMAGRGGHGHNDLLSFELCIAGEAIVVDPGCSGYTANLEKKDQYRSTTSHATVGLFGEEIARFSGYWGICNDAHPQDINISEESEVVTVQASHDGYERIAAGTKVSRFFTVNPQQQKLTIEDTIYITSQKVNVHWSFPLGESTPIPKDSKKVNLKTKQNTDVTIESTLPISLLSYQLSHGYGQEVESKKIVAGCQWENGMNYALFHIYQNQGRKI